MCSECEYGRATGIRAIFNHARYVLDKLLGLDALRYNNMCRFFELPGDFKEALEAEMKDYLHNKGPRHSWGFARFVSRRLDHYEAVRR